MDVVTQVPPCLTAQHKNAGEMCFNGESYLWLLQLTFKSYHRCMWFRIRKYKQLSFIVEVGKALGVDKNTLHIKKTFLYCKIMLLCDNKIRYVYSMISYFIRYKINIIFNMIRYLLIYPIHMIIIY